MLAMQQIAQYKWHRPENTLLYQLVERHYPEFKETLSEQGKQLPKFVECEFDEFLRCGRLEYGFLRVVCVDCKREKLVAFSCKLRAQVTASQCGKNSPKLANKEDKQSDN